MTVNKLKLNPRFNVHANAERVAGVTVIPIILSTLISGIPRRAALVGGQGHPMIDGFETECFVGVDGKLVDAPNVEAECR